MTDRGPGSGVPMPAGMIGVGVAVGVMVGVVVGVSVAVGNGVVDGVGVCQRFDIPAHLTRNMFTVMQMHKIAIKSCWIIRDRG